MILAVWGSGSSGKTLLSTRIGLTLAKQKRKVLIIYTEIGVVDIAWIYPKEKSFISMGELWQKDLDVEDIYRYFMVVNGYKDLAYLSFKPGENIFSYPGFTKFNVVRIMSLLQEIFDFIIVDCASDISANTIATTALEMADTVYRLIGTGLKDSFFFDSNLSLIADSRFAAENHVNILSNTKYYEPINVYRSRYSDIRYELDFDENLYFHVMEGGAAILNNCKYDRVIAKMIRNDLFHIKDCNRKGSGVGKGKEKMPEKGKSFWKKEIKR